MKTIKGYGPAVAEIFFVLPFPEREDVLLGQAMSGMYGKVLLKLCADAGINNFNLRFDYLYNQPVKGEAPTDAEILEGYPIILQKIDRSMAGVVVLVGKLSQRYLKKEFPDAINLMDPSALIATGVTRSPYLLLAIRTLEVIGKILK